jgi:large subunit ribosomal protein L18
MGKHTAPRRKARLLRQQRVRRHLAGTTARPRLAVFRSLRHIYAQVIDDSSGRTLVSASTLDHELRAQMAGLSKRAQARLVGKAVAQRAQAAGVQRVAFDRGGFLYHGRIKELADGSREGGLDF